MRDSHGDSVILLWLYFFLCGGLSHLPTGKAASKIIASTSGKKSFRLLLLRGLFKYLMMQRGSTIFIYQVRWRTWLLICSGRMRQWPPHCYVQCLDLNSQGYISSPNLAWCRFLTVLEPKFPPPRPTKKNTKASTLRVCSLRKAELKFSIEEKPSVVEIELKSSCIHKVSINTKSKSVV